MGPLWIAVLLALFVGGFAAGWAARKDDARRYVAENKRYYAARIAEVEAELDAAEARLAQLQQLAPAVPATAQQTVVHVHMPAYPAAAVPAPQYLYLP